MTFLEFLNESPLPDDWDKSKYKGKIDYREMIRYAMERATTVGEGSSRVAFKINYEGRDTVLKISKNQKGIAQTAQEVKYLKDSYIEKLGVLIPLVDYDKENIKPRWVQTELASSVNNEIFIKECGLPLSEFVLYCSHIVKRPARYDEVKFKERASKIKENSKLYQNFIKLIRHYPDIEIGDLLRLENWGLYTSSPVILDIGFDSVSKSLYKL